MRITLNRDVSHHLVRKCQQLEISNPTEFVNAVLLSHLLFGHCPLCPESVNASSPRMGSRSESAQVNELDALLDNLNLSSKEL